MKMRNLGLPKELYEYEDGEDEEFDPNEGLPKDYTRFNYKKI
jgi:hypothetical protein